MDPKIKLVEFIDAREFDVDVGLEIAGVVFYKDVELLAEFLDVFEGGVEVDRDEELLLHEFRARDVFDRFGVEDVVGDLRGFLGFDAAENGVEEGYVLDGVALVFDVDAVTYIVWIWSGM